jgi:hypothetical protein
MTQRSYARIYKRFRDEKPMGLASPGLYYLKEKEELVAIDDDIMQLTSEFLVSRAEKYQLLAPDFDGQSARWENSKITGRYRLTHAAILELRSAVHTAQKERGEIFRLWLASITGLIGVLIGLLAVILGRR